MPSLSFGLLAAPLLSGLFSTAAALPSRRPVPVSARAAFTRSGCFTDTDAGHRALSADFKGDDTMTVDMCAEYCSAYHFFGIEYGRECYCGNERAAGSLPAPDAECSFSCPGDATQTCGAGSRIEIYVNDAYTPPAPPVVPDVGVPYLGCFVDGGVRALPDRIISEDDMTAARCAANCEGYAYFGTQWSRECYCGNSAPTEAAPASDCNMACSGDATEMCGAGMRLSVYGPVGTTTPPVVDPTNPAAVGNFVYDGCYTDSIALRVLSGDTISSPDMTLASCAAICSGYAYFGVEYGIQCFCGAELDASAVKAPETECTMHCPGDDSLICGDANRLTVYKNTTPRAPSSPATAGAFKYQSCWTDSVGERSLSGQSEVRAEMTVEICAAFCEGYAFFGLEYSTECYCGNELAGQAADEVDCSQLCAGNAEQWCGGANRLNLYAINPWTTPSSTTAIPESTSVIPEPTETEVAPETTTSLAPESTEVAEATTSAVAESTEAGPESTTSVVPESTEAAETTSAAPESTETLEATSSPVESTAVPEITSPALTSTETSSTGGVPSTTFAPPTSTVADETSTITTPAQLTTVTSCGSPTIVPGQTRCWGALPNECHSLTSSAADWWEYSLLYDICTMYLGWPIPTQVESCVPPSFDTPEQGTSFYSCIETAGLTCSSSSECATATYTVGQEPATTPPAPAPTPAPADAVVPNGGFETGTKDGWNPVDNFLPYDTDELTTAHVHSGKYALRAVHLNNAAHNSALSRDVDVIPGANYTFSFWIDHENPLSSGPDCGVVYNIVPTVENYGYTEGGVAFRWYPVGQWQQITVDFQAIATWATLTLTYYCNVGRNLGAVEGRDTFYIDDIELLSRDKVQG